MTDDRTTELIPCPICGKKVYIGLYGGVLGYWWMIHGGTHFDECQCRIFMESCKFELEDETRVDYDEYAMNIRGGLVRRWNTRADVDNGTSELENGWHLRSEGYMTPEYSYQRIYAMKANRALDNHGRLVFVKHMGGKEVDSRVYSPHQPDLESHVGALKTYASSARTLLEETYGLALRFLETVPDDRKTVDDYVQMESINDELEKLGIEV